MVPVTGLAKIQWTRKQLLVAAFVVLYVVFQLAVPAAMLAVRGGWFFAPSSPHTGELPFSWQMYTVVLAPATVDVVWPDGRRERAPAAQLLGSSAAEPPTVTVHFASCAPCTPGQYA